MSDTCLKCRTEEALLESQSRSWHGVSNYSTHGVVVDGIQVEKVEIYKQSDNMEDYYGDYPQGWEGDMWMTFRVGDRFFRKMGSISSYGNESWDGPFREVFQTEKVVTVFEFKEDK